MAEKITLSREFFLTGVVSQQLLQLKEHRSMNDLKLAVPLKKKTLGNQRESALFFLILQLLLILFP